MPEIFPPPLPKAVGSAAEGGDKPKKLTPFDEGLLAGIPGAALATALGLRYAPAKTAKVLKWGTGIERTEGGRFVPKSFALLYLAPAPFGIVDPTEYDLRPGYLYAVLGDNVPESSFLQVLPEDAPEVQQFRAERAARLGSNAPAYDPTRVARLAARNYFLPGTPVQGIIRLATAEKPITSINDAAKEVGGSYVGRAVDWVEGELRGTNQSTMRTKNYSFLPDLDTEFRADAAGAVAGAVAGAHGEPAAAVVASGGFSPAALAALNALALANAERRDRVDKEGNIELRDP